MVKFTKERAQSIANSANRFWFFALLASLLANVYKIRMNNLRIIMENKALKQASIKGARDEVAEKSYKALAK